MPSANRNKKNQPPTGEGKKQSPQPGRAKELHKRSEVLQAAGSRQNIGTAMEDVSQSSSASVNPKRPKAGR